MNFLQEPPKRRWRWTRRFLFGLAVLVVLAIGIDGTIEVASPSDTIQIQRDANGVPHVLAASPADAYFGLGFSSTPRAACSRWSSSAAWHRDACRN